MDFGEFGIVVEKGKRKTNVEEVAYFKILARAVLIVLLCFGRIGGYLI